MTLTLHGFPMSPNSRRVHVMLEELGVPYQYVEVSLMEGAHKAPAYLALNPNGRVPTLVDGDVSLWESHAIMEHLAERFPDQRLGAQGARERGEIAQWTYLNAAHFGPAVAGVFAHTIRLPEDQRVPKIAENGRAEANRVMTLLDRELSSRPFIALERLTIADLAFLPTLAVAPMLGFDLSERPALSRWLTELKARPSWQKVAG